MESRERLEAKGKILVEALIMCLSRSQVRDVASAETIRSVITSALGELWREGEFRLEPVWKLLCAQPGLSAQTVAPPLFLFKAHEEQLGVAVRLPQALAAVPRAEQARLRDALGVKPDELSSYIKELSDLQSAEREGRKAVEAGHKAAAQVDAAASQRASAGEQERRQKKLAPVAAALGLVAAVAIGVALYVGLSSSAATFDTADVASLVQLANGARAGSSVTARIVDPRWESLGHDEQKRLAGEVFDRELPKGIHAMTWQDAQGRVRVIASDAATGKQIIVR